MAQARERGIDPKLSPELEALIMAYDGLHSAQTKTNEKTHLDLHYEQVVT
jgi:hypothetical protein